MAVSWPPVLLREPEKTPTWVHESAPIGSLIQEGTFSHREALRSLEQRYKLRYLESKLNSGAMMTTAPRGRESY